MAKINVMLTCTGCNKHLAKEFNNAVPRLAPCKTCGGAWGYRTIKATLTASTCNEDCRDASTNFCRCSCGGANHGKKGR